MPASSQGLPTSLMRADRFAALAAGDLDRVDPGPVRASGPRTRSQPSTARSPQLVLGADDLERCRRLRIRRSAAPGPSSASWRSSSRPCCAASPARAPGRTPGSRSPLRVTSHHRLAQLVHADEPLVDQPEDQLGAAAPADRVAVRVLLGAIEQALLARGCRRSAAATSCDVWPVSQRSQST